MTSQLITEREALVFLEETTTDSRGNVTKRPSDDAVMIRCRLAPRATASDKAGSDQPRFSLLAPIDAPLGRWSRVVMDDVSYTCTSWPRRVAEGHPAVEHIAVELVQER